MLTQDNITRTLFLLILIFQIQPHGYAQQLAYPVVDTKVTEFSSHYQLISEPGPGDPFYGQDATYHGNEPSYTDHGNGTVTDHVTGLIWQKDMGEKITYEDAFLKADSMTLGGYSDWRVPTLKELYSLILFTGRVSGATAISPFIDTDYFIQPLGDPDLGEREIDAQTWSSTQYAGLTMNGDSTVFGVNFVDGRIKGYPKYSPGSNNTTPRTMYFRMVRENPSYGINEFEENKNETISDLATGLMWQKADDGILRDWEGALAYAESLELGGYNDWRLPNAKELQSIVDYTRSPQSTGTPAIDPLFSTTEIKDPDGNPGQYPYFWTGTTHKDGVEPYSSAVYIAFGEAQGEMNGKLMDVHGAGAQRSDPKSGDPDTYPQFFGPQGDVRYVYNAVRCVRDINAATVSLETIVDQMPMVYPNPASDLLTIRTADDGEHQGSLINVFGQCLQEWTIEESSTIDVSSLSPGIYLISVDGKSGVKFIKR